MFSMTNWVQNLNTSSSINCLACKQDVAPMKAASCRMCCMPIYCENCYTFDSGNGHNAAECREIFYQTGINDMRNELHSLFNEINLISMLFQFHLENTFVPENTIISTNEAIRKNEISFEKLEANLRSNYSIALTACVHDHCYFETLSEYFKNDISIAQIVITRNPLALQHAGEIAKDNARVVLEAVSQDGNALQFASKRIRDNWRQLFQKLADDAIIGGHCCRPSLIKKCNAAMGRLMQIELEDEMQQVTARLNL